MAKNDFSVDLSRRLWEAKYRHGGSTEEPDISASWQRVSRAIASVEPRDSEVWAWRFSQLLGGFGFLPGGRILAGAGTSRQVTLFNCFVMGRIEDSIDGIFSALREGAITMQQGGGVGYDFSTLRPRGSEAQRTNTIASGPVSFMRIWDAMCATLLSTGARRGAMMATLRCDHPDIEEFIAAKHGTGALSHFNLSVLISDEFMAAVRSNAQWELLFPVRELDSSTEDEIVMRRWSGGSEAVPCKVFRRVAARQLWESILRASYDAAEPGVLFIDRINRLNNLRYREDISATNPCGEIPLPPYGACDLGSINLVTLVQEPFTPQAHLHYTALESMVSDAVRFLDNVIDLSRYPLPQQQLQAQGSRRIGLGITGLGDALLMLGLHYDSDAARATAAEVMRTLCHAAYRASVELAIERGAFPFFVRDDYLRSPFVAALPEDIREAIAMHGIRNSHLLAIAPTGTISLLANNISSGLEPVFAWEYQRRVLTPDGSYQQEEVQDYAWRLWRDMEPNGELPACFVTAQQLTPRAHIAMQAALQAYVDNAISKTINIPPEMEFAEYRAVYDEAYEAGLKGCTTFRPGSTGDAILEPVKKASHCCSIEREAD